MFTTLGQINDNKQDNYQLIQRVGNDLKFGGYFILEIPHRDWLIENLKPFERFGGGNTSTEGFRSYTMENHIVTEKFNVHTNQESSTYLLKYRVYGLNELKELLTKSKFYQIAIHGAYTEKTLGPDDPNVVVIAQRQP